MPVGKDARRIGEFNERLKQALVFRKQPLFEAGNARAILNARAGQPAAIIEIAGLLLVDPRWLATGERSPAGIAAGKRLDVAQAMLGLTEKDYRLVIACVERTAQPSLCPGVCRYCACSEERACPGGCQWVDRQATICSACLQVP